MGGEDTLEREAEITAGEQRQQKRPRKLPIRQPDLIPRIAPFERQHIDEYRLTAAEQNIVGSGVL